MGLAAIMTDDEQNHLAKVVKMAGVISAWLGGARVAEKRFFWYRHKTGSHPSIDEIPKYYWRSGEPSGEEGKEPFLKMYSTGKWNDYVDNILAAICELRC